MDQTTVKKELRELITKYERALSTGALKKYTEEETKKDFILPLFEILGWNVYDKNEVSAEEHIRSSGRVDYGFYLHERPRFYLEAKPFKADLHREEYARQAIQYAWNRGVTWAVLTDFESIKVFNTQDISQYLANKLFFEIPYREYLPRFDQLWLLSKEAFGVDLIDKEAERVGKKLQRVSVGTLLYKDLNECRTILTKELATWNEKVPRGLLDEGVQKLLDRIIFLRVAEDRGIEPPTLLPLIREWKSSKTKRHLYQSMVEKFRELDGIYNSNLFLPHPLEKWEEYSDATEKVVSILYGKRGYYEYDFKAIPADILGSVYENYLGYRLSQSKKGVTLDKDSRKRKEHGIYYTPAFIVDYIVKNTLKPVLDQCRGIGDVKKIKVLDPACGSGSFLLKALEVINDKYKSFGNRGNAWTKLTILSENLYGVDLDEQAVEIARLNLLINALDERIKFPLLSNIKNGNSLISGTDSELKKYFGAKFREKKPFKWEEEYPAVFKTGGFDVVIGNPPYIFARGGSFNDKEKSYYYDRFKLQQYQINTYLLFIERAYNLLKEGGVLGFIVPNNWLTISSFSKLREFVLKNVGELRIINAVDSVFSQASVDTCLLLFRKMSPTKVQLGELRSGAVPSPTIHEPKEFYLNNFIINISKLRSSLGNSLTEKLNRLPRLGDVAVVSTGLKAYQIGKGKPPQTAEIKDLRKFHSKKKLDAYYKPYLDGVDVKRYQLNWSGEYLSYGDWLAEPRRSVPFDKPRILVRQIPSPFPHCVNATFVEDCYLNDINSMVIFDPKSGYNFKYLLGVINSKLISYWFTYTFDKFQRKIFPQFKVRELASFPTYPATKTQQRELVGLVGRIIELNFKLKHYEENSNRWQSTKSEIEKIDKKIDEEIYKLYGLTPEEIKVVDGSNKHAE